MDRPRQKRRHPERTEPIRNAGGAWREDDAASAGVRAGYRVIEEQIRRGRRMAQTLDEEDRRDGRTAGARRRQEDTGRSRGESRGGFRLLETQMRHIGLLAREILRQMSAGRPDPWRLSELVFRLYAEAIGELARFGFGALGGLTGRRDTFAADVDAIDRDIDDTWDGLDEFDDQEDEEGEVPWDWPAAPGAPAVIRTKVPIPVWIASEEATEVDLDLPAGTQLQDLEVEEPGSGDPSGVTEPGEPAFSAAFVALAEGPVILRIEIPHGLPAGLYVRRILDGSTDEPAGSLKVRVGPPARARRR